MNNAVLPDFLITPRQLVQDREIQPLDRHVYGVIYWYTTMRLQKCTATNGHIAEILGVSKSGVNKAIVRLVKKGYVHSLYDRKHHSRTLIPLIVSRQESTIPNETGAVSQTYSNEEAVSQTGKGTVPNGLKNQLQTASPIKEDRIKEKEDIYNISSGTKVPNDPAKEKQNEYGNEEVNAILAAFSTHIGHIPSDKKPRQVAQNIRQIIHTFINHHTDLFLQLRNRPLTFAYVHTQSWKWYLEKEYAPQTEKLETCKLKMRMYLDYVAKKLAEEAATKYNNEKSGYAGDPGKEGARYVHYQT